MKFAAIGRTRLLYDAIEACTQEGHEAVWIATAREAPEYDRTQDDFEALAGRLGCAFHRGPKIHAPDAIASARQSDAEVAISVNWPTLLRGPLRDCFADGIVNCHGGDLPRFRGNACQAWAIILGESQVVISLHEMVDALDAGPIYLQRSIPIDGATTIGELQTAMTAQVPTMFVELLNGLANRTLPAPRPQPEDPSLALRTHSRRPSDGLLNWSQSAIDLDRLIRASSEPLAGAYTALEGRRLRVWRAAVVPTVAPEVAIPGQVVELHNEQGAADIATGSGRLRVLELQPEGSQRCPATEVLGSTRQRLGPSAEQMAFEAFTRIAELEARLAALEDERNG